MLNVVANWIPFEEPAGGPNFYPFADDARYEIHIDNDGDAKPEISYRWDFDSGFMNGGHVPLQHGARDVADRPGSQLPAELHAHGAP